MSVLTIDHGGMVTHDPSDQRIYVFNFSDALGAGVTIDSTRFKITCVNGIGTIETPVTLVCAVSTVTATSLTPHGYTTGDSITIAGAVPIGGASPSAYNGTFTITVLTPTTFSYTVTGSPTSPATGTITAAKGIDNAGVLSAAPYNSLYASMRFDGSVGTLGAIYEVACHIVTHETPAQGKEKSFRIKMENS